MAIVVQLPASGRVGREVTLSGLLYPHRVGKDQTQKIESKHINLRTRIKRLVRRTICFSKTERMHDLVIGLFINRYEFGRLL
jgi:IS1 family transposase